MMAEEGRTTLDPDFIVGAYRLGYFPMADPKTGAISWYSPDPRAIIPLSTFRPSRSLRQFLRKQVFDLRVNTSFLDVIRGCTKRDDTWISEEIVNAYAILHTMGYAHSVESWEGDELVGGLYGVAIRGAFFGESMFSKASNASKVALVHLVQILNRRGFTLLDSQFINEHISQFGAVEISRATYLELLSNALAVKAEFP